MDADFSQIHERLESVFEQAEQLTRLAAHVAVEDIRERTVSGLDVNESQFTEYVPRYQRKKEAAGKYTGKVNLRWSGGLHADIGYQDAGDGVEIFFSEAYVQIARGNQERWGRNFFGVNEITVGKVTDTLLPAVQLLLHGNQ